jgi:hypothetical protein
MIKTCKPELILADLKVQCDEAPDILINRSLMKAAQKFGSETCMFDQWIDIPTQSGVQHYPFERYIPEGFGVQYVTDVKYNGCCIPCLDQSCDEHCKSGYTLDDMQQITLHGYCPRADQGDPACRDTLQVRVTLRLRADVCELPCDMVERFEEELMDGALGFLLSMKNKKWNDNQAAEFYENRFAGGIASAKCLLANKMNPGDQQIPGERMM